MNLLESSMAKLTATQHHLRSHRKLVLASLAGLLLVALLYSVWIYRSATAVERLLDEAEALDITAIASGEEQPLMDAQALVERSNAATGSLSGRLGPTRVAASSFGWIPWIGDQLRTPGLLTERAKVDLETTRPLVAAAEDLFTLQRLIANGGLSGSGTSDELDRVIESLEYLAAEVEIDMENIRSTSARMDGFSLIGMFKSRERRVTSLEKRLLSLGELLVAAPPAVSDARDVAVAAQNAIDQLRSASTTGELDVISESITRLAVESAIAADSLAQLEVLVSETMQGSEFAALVSDLAASMSAVAELSSGLAVIASSLESALEILKESDGPLLSNGTELQESLSILIAQDDSVGDAVDRAIGAVNTLTKLIASGRADFLPTDLNDALIEQTSDLVNVGKLIRGGPELLLDLIAAGTTKTYLVLGLTSDELRASGGFTSSAWTLTFTDGSLSDTNYIPILEFDDPRFATQAQLPPPKALAYYMDAQAMYLRDVGWEPDYAAVGRIAAELYRRNQDGEVDGVIAITQWGIVRLIEAVGGIEVEGDFISPAQTLEVIETRTDSDGTGYLQELFVGLLESLRGDSPAGAQFELLQALSEIVEHKDLMLFSANQNTQNLVEDLNWAGRFPVDGRDRLALVDSNVGWSKSDRSIERAAEYNVNLAFPGQPIADLTVSYKNTGSEVGRHCDLQSIPSGEFALYDISKHSCYWNYFRSYVAVGSELISGPQLPLPPQSVAGRLGRQDTGTSTFAHEFDEYGDNFTGLLAMAPGEDEEFTISYRLPSSVVQQTASGFAYELVLVAQPGAQGREVTVQVRLPAGQSLSTSSHEPTSSSGDVVTFEFDLVTDQVLRLETERT